MAFSGTLVFRCLLNIKENDNVYVDNSEIHNYNTWNTHYLLIYYHIIQVEKSYYKLRF